MAVLPLFPQFKKLELSDRGEIESLVKQSQLPPYADFGFVNMWIWNTTNDILVSRYQKNLVVVFRDYVSGEPFLSFIGRNHLSETAEKVLAFSNTNYHVSHLKLVPEEIAKQLETAGFSVKLDEDSNDYVYTVSHLAKMDQWIKSTKGRNVRRLIKKYSSYQTRQTVIDEVLGEQLKSFFKKWAGNKNLAQADNLNEYKAFTRLVALRSENVRAVLLYVENILVGFTIYELVPSSIYAISRFAKADTKYDSAIYDLLNWEEAKVLEKQGVEYYNWEQDLGLPGLRYSKMKYNPTFMLKKFLVTMKPQV